MPLWLIILIAAVALGILLWIGLVLRKMLKPTLTVEQIELRDRALKLHRTIQQEIVLSNKGPRSSELKDTDDDKGSGRVSSLIELDEQIQKTAAKLGKDDSADSELETLLASALDILDWNNRLKER